MQGFVRLREREMECRRSRGERGIVGERWVAHVGNKQHTVLAYLMYMRHGNKEKRNKYRSWREDEMKWSLFDWCKDPKRIEQHHILSLLSTYPTPNI